MRSYEFYTLDVFTDKAFTGNPLAVFPDARGISDEEMQKIAAEMNLSETVFVLPSDRALRKLRIFTPRQELPLAGHPVVGTWNLLSRLGVVEVIGEGNVRIEHELSLGVLPVDIQFKDGKPANVVMTQARFEPGELVTNEDEIAKLAAGLGLERTDIADRGNLPVQVVSTGIRSLDVPVTSLVALEKCRISPERLSEAYQKFDAIGVFAFTFETRESGSSASGRFFAPADAIPEDPATGSAAGSFSAYAVYHGAIDPGDFVIEQGDFMNRPSRIYAYVDGKKGAVGDVRIGGSSVVISKGEFYLA